MVDNRLAWLGLGIGQEVTSKRQLYLRGEFDKLIDYAIKSQTHLWTVILTHRASDSMLDAFDGESDDMPLLDSDSLIIEPLIGCYLCEESYTPRLRNRKCKGMAGL